MENDETIAQLIRRVEELERAVASQLKASDVKEMIRSSVYFPPLSASSVSKDEPFMVHSNCFSGDFWHPRYAQLCKLMNDRPRWHRKQWEYIFIMHHLLQSQMLREGKSGVGFGVGMEPLPSAFALLGAKVMATDAPSDVGQTGGWIDSKEYSASLAQMKFPWITDKVFYDRVSFRACDMNAIDEAISGYDFTWSSCCLEHLGSLQKGLDFITNSVEKCLKIGGIAVHTTELNLSSETDTVEVSDSTVLYRRKDLESFAGSMRDRGHEVNPIVIAPVEHALDYHVDVPPYNQDPHLRLLLAGYVTTSVGLVIRRGR